MATGELNGKTVKKRLKYNIDAINEDVEILLG